MALPASECVSTSLKSGPSSHDHVQRMRSAAATVPLATTPAGDGGGGGGGRTPRHKLGALHLVTACCSRRAPSAFQARGRR